MRLHFPTYLQNASGLPIPLAPYHHDFWARVWRIRLGQPAEPFVAIWPRGGGKSTTAELATAVVGYFRLRRYGLYVCGTQEQADDHVGNIAGIFESPSLGITRAVGKYGQSKGWRRNRLRTEYFTLDGIGLDTAARGIKIDETRPDWMVLDDLDDESDSIKVLERKEKALTRKILPTGSADMAVFGIQNLPHPEGLFTKLVDGRADYLTDKVLSGPYKAIDDLEVDDSGPGVRITGGTPTWEGFDLTICQERINKMGLRAFLVECQHEIDAFNGALFQRHWFQLVDDYPRDARRIRYWDLASTPDGDWTAGALVAMQDGQYWLADLRRVRATPKGVEDLVRQTAALDGRAVHVFIEQEPGSSGKATIDHYQRHVLPGYVVRGHRTTGSKVERAGPVASAAEAGNLYLADGVWNGAFLDEAEQFPLAAHDDQIDALSGAVTMLQIPIGASTVKVKGY